MATSDPVRFRIQGLLAERLDRAVQRLRSYPFSPMFVRSDVTFEMPRIFTAYSGDISGRYIEFFSIYGQMGYATPGLPELVQQVLAAQKPAGYFGIEGFDKSKLTDRETKIFWGNGRLLIGLMEYYRLSGDASVLAAARRLGDFLFDCGLHESTSSIGAAVAADAGAAGFATTFCSCIEGIVRLFEITRDSRYAKLAKGVAALLPETFEGFHSHGRMTALRGMVDLALATNDQAMMDRVIGQWNAIAADHVLPTGGVREHFGDACTRDEACSVADWVMLSLKLFAATGGRKYLQMAEHGLLNHLLSSQFGNGGFGHQALVLDRIEGHDPLVTGIGPLLNGRVEGTFKEAYWCCSFHGPRAMFEVARHAVTSSSDSTISINLPLSGEAESHGLKMFLTADPFGRTLDIAISKAPATPVTLQLLIPNWAHNPVATVKAEGGKQEPVTIGSDALQVPRQWHAGDQLQVQFHPNLHAQNVLSPAQRAYARDQEGLFYGPLLLGYECSDDLLWGQLMDASKVSAKMVVVEDHPRLSSAPVPLQMPVEYHDHSQNRTIWSPRGLIPTMLRHNDQPLRTVHTLTHRPFRALTKELQEELLRV